MVSRRGVSPFPALALGSGLLKRRKKESGFPCWVNIAVLRQHTCTRFALGRFLMPYGAETRRVSSLGSKSSVTRGGEAVEMVNKEFANLHLSTNPVNTCWLPETAVCHLCRARL